MGPSNTTTRGMSADCGALDVKKRREKKVRWSESSAVCLEMKRGRAYSSSSSPSSDSSSLSSWPLRSSSALPPVPLPVLKLDRVIERFGEGGSLTRRRKFCRASSDGEYSVEVGTGLIERVKLHNADKCIQV